MAPREAAATPEARSPAPGARGAGRGGALQTAIDLSPRIQTQRRALDALFGEARQRHGGNAGPVQLKTASEWADFKAAQPDLRAEDFETESGYDYFKYENTSDSGNKAIGIVRGFFGNEHGIVDDGLKSQMAGDFADDEMLFIDKVASRRIRTPAAALNGTLGFAQKNGVFNVSLLFLSPVVRLEGSEAHYVTPFASDLVDTAKAILDENSKAPQAITGGVINHVIFVPLLESVARFLDLYRHAIKANLLPVEDYPVGDARTTRAVRFARENFPAFLNSLNQGPVKALMRSATGAGMRIEEMTCDLVFRNADPLSTTKDRERSDIRLDSVAKIQDIRTVKTATG